MEHLPMAFNTTNPLIQVEDDRTGLSVETLKRALADNLFYLQGKFPAIATKNDCYMALAYTIRDRLLQRWLNTFQTYLNCDNRVVCYLSAEYLLGPHLGNNLINLGLWEPVQQAVEESGLSLDELIDIEEEPGLGNGGLGRLAACFMDSLATLEIPAIGYGIRYEFGIFDQEIKDGWQVEITDKWLQLGNPWEIARPESAVLVKLGGHTEPYTDDQGNYRVRWIAGSLVKGIPYDTPILGYKVSTANNLRLWKSEAAESFDFQRFNVGDYYGAVQDKMSSENLTKVLYPNDEQIQGKELRLAQQYFFVSCSLQDMIRIHLSDNPTLENFHEHFAVQMNDTHPSIAVAELMRLLVDEHHYEWQRAWAITEATFGFTNHTLLPEALEKWSLPLFGEMLPRHLEIIYEINQRFLDQVRMKYPNDGDRLARLSIIDEAGEKSVRMAYLATVGSHAINGVAALHSQLVKETILKDFYELWPEKFSNKTNGVTPRRWMVLSNPRLSNLISSRIGDGWIKNLDELKQLEPFADLAGFRQDWCKVKREVKQDLARYIHTRTDLVVNPDSLFDVQVKRIHEYKRQHLNILHVIHLYLQIKNNPNLDVTPRTFIYGGKAAPGYFTAKLIIKLINSVADVVNNDPTIGDRLKVIFLPDYNVKFGQRVYPAADLSEQISTAGKEASGTGNMKFSMNGALTIGTLDGANIEIREEVGAENFFLFGLTTPEVEKTLAEGYQPWEYYNNNANLKAVVDLINSGFFSHGDTALFRPLMDSLLGQDPYLVFADFQAYVDCQNQVGEAYKDQENWARMAILNVARMGKFSSDRTIREYAEDIWAIKPVVIELEDLCPDGQCLLISPNK
ncbi:glycogen phosphorylase [Synechocystis sp. PCC 6803]|uniref:Glycogen phosphorylase n=1 Tax=Synechocystis sp. (strain ATCC 27184 / PCC 6803 / Kazusa) TaxID=1111708 RepID=PHSG_SYNY3|nr:MULTISPECIES: glycogen/starch/alpha-glucan phosphorylase [unclassified Synechocystis]P73511.1 RecName: Full=Glycogen phosphorylase [Synechocystis sp. PCC 6803 substr. Kazusa]AGF51240.1 glycogen phosphorylase [Synechocystis sp. PCC 6803]ALJ67258.1 maltodextrin phosphorylase [Synechocystis sp. PCC 6803]AVP89099.1 glycogen phosphorylase [Synechocystis sp. IPPAS B-1465]MBD2618466.1 glycogen/starch/alpha-glucan phosphorylase [Synechocystis sp. FACHB-898]MBD2640135.1 glycogen/starch/alpha-glucan